MWPGREVRCRDLTIVTGASGNHFRCLGNLLASIAHFEPVVRTLVYDLGLSAPQRAAFPRHANQWLRAFPFERHPGWIKIKNGGEKASRCGYWAWKPVIMQDALLEFGGPALWLDAGDLLTGALDELRRVLDSQGVYSPASNGTVARWTHPETLERLLAGSETLGRPNRNAAIIGLNPARAAGREIARRWRESCLDRRCIAPAGASLANHRYDQAVLTVLIYQAQREYGFTLVDRRLNVSYHNDHLPAWNRGQPCCNI